MKYNTLNNLIGWIVFLIAAVTYLLTIEPTHSYWDCGEYISSAVKLEITHSPGAAFFQIIGAAFAGLSFGDNTVLSKLINSLSALFSAFTILFLFWTITHFVRKVLSIDDKKEELSKSQKIIVLSGGVIGALTFTFTDTFWFSAVEGEVYAAASCFTALLLWLICKWEREADLPRSDRWILLISLVIGLSVGVHLMAILVVPSIGYIYYARKYKFTWKSFIYASIIIGIIFIIVFKIIFPLTMSFFGKSEIYFVNGLRMGFNSGSVFAFIVLALLFVGLIYYTVKNNKKLYNTIVLSVLFMLIGFSSWVILPIRANANTPINLNDPDNAIGMLDYYNRAQYGDWPVAYGANYTAYLDKKGILNVEKGNPIYEKSEKDKRYIKTGNRITYKFNPAHESILPRMYNPATDIMENYASMQEYPDFEKDFEYAPREAERYMKSIGIDSNYRNQVISGISKQQDSIVNILKMKKEAGVISIQDYIQTKEYINIKKPTLWQNVGYMVDFQMGYMFVRYFMWNFAGRQNDWEGNYGSTKGNWESGVKFVDNLYTENKEHMPSIYKNKGTNHYYFLPLLLGLIGFAFQISRDTVRWFALLALFVLTSIGIVFYTNVRAFEPRERDYALVSSFYTFAIWIGIGVAAILYALKSVQPKLMIPVSVLMLGIPILVGSQNWDDHDRSRRYAAYDFANNYLKSMDDNNPILFVYGDNDTYPLWGAQEIEEIRVDAKVVNFTLLDTPWYIDQTHRKTYTAPAIPFSMQHEEYRENVNDQIGILSKNDWQQIFEYKPDLKASLGAFTRFATEDAMTAKEAIDYLRNKVDIPDFKNQKSKVLQMMYRIDPTNDSENSQYNILPVNKIIIPVNKENVIKYGIVKKEDENKIVDSLIIEIPSLHKSTLTMLDMLANYNWDRSIYFSSGGTYSNDNLLYLQDYLEYQGLFSKLVPIYTKSLPNEDKGRINSNNLYTIFTNYKFGNLKDTKAYFDETCRRDASNYRNVAAKLALQLANEGEKKKAAEVLDIINIEVPVKLYTMNVLFINMVRASILAGEEAKGLKLAEDYKNQQLEELRYFANLPVTKLNSEDLQRSGGIYFYIVQSVSETLLFQDKEKETLEFIENSKKPMQELLKIENINPNVSEMIKSLEEEMDKLSSVVKNDKKSE